MVTVRPMRLLARGVSATSLAVSWMVTSLIDAGKATPARPERSMVLPDFEQDRACGRLRQVRAALGALISAPDCTSTLPAALMVICGWTSCWK